MNTSLSTVNGRDFDMFVNALLHLLDRKLITPEEVRYALSDWGMRLDLPMRATIADVASASDIMASIEQAAIRSEKKRI